MSKKIVNIILLTFFSSFVFFITNYYFSEKNVTMINKSRSFYSSSLNNFPEDLPVLRNNTNNVIIYINDLEDFKNKRKKRAWENLITDYNE
jgi:hypothetical protein